MATEALNKADTSRLHWSRQTVMSLATELKQRQDLSKGFHYKHEYISRLVELDLKAYWQTIGTAQQQAKLQHLGIAYDNIKPELLHEVLAREGTQAAAVALLDKKTKDQLISQVKALGGSKSGLRYKYELVNAVLRLQKGQPMEPRKTRTTHGLPKQEKETTPFKVSSPQTEPTNAPRPPPSSQSSLSSPLGSRSASTDYWKEVAEIEAERGEETLKTLTAIAENPSAATAQNLLKEFLANSTYTGAACTDESLGDVKVQPRDGMSVPSLEQSAPAPTASAEYPDLNASSHGESTVPKRPRYNGPYSELLNSIRAYVEDDGCDIEDTTLPAASYSDRARRPYNSTATEKPSPKLTQARHTSLEGPSSSRGPPLVPALNIFHGPADESACSNPSLGTIASDNSASQDKIFDSAPADNTPRDSLSTGVKGDPSSRSGALNISNIESANETIKEKDSNFAAIDIDAAVNKTTSSTPSADESPSAKSSLHTATHGATSTADRETDGKPNPRAIDSPATSGGKKSGRTADKPVKSPTSRKPAGKATPKASSKVTAKVQDQSSDGESLAVKEATTQKKGMGEESPATGHNVDDVVWIKELLARISLIHLRTANSLAAFSKHPLAKAGLAKTLKRYPNSIALFDYLNTQQATQPRTLNTSPYDSKGGFDQEWVVSAYKASETFKKFREEVKKEYGVDLSATE